MAKSRCLFSHLNHKNYADETGFTEQEKYKCIVQKESQNVGKCSLCTGQFYLLFFISSRILLRNVTFAGSK